MAELHGICLLGEIRWRYGFQKWETKKSEWLWGWIRISPKENVMWKLSSSKALPSAQIMGYFRCFTFGQIVCGVNGLDSSLDFRPSATIIGICRYGISIRTCRVGPWRLDLNFETQTRKFLPLFCFFLFSPFSHNLFFYVFLLSCSSLGTIQAWVLLSKN